MTKRVLCILWLAGAVVGYAKAEQGCPYASSVHYSQGYFQASEGRSMWRSLKLGSRNYVDVFIGALFTPGRGQNRENGLLEKCVYRTGDGQMVALRHSGKEKVDSMSLTGTSYWRLVSDPLGQDVYICQDSQPDNCSFTVKLPNR